MSYTVSVIEKIHTLETAAAELGCNSRVLREKVANGEITARKTLGKWYVLHSELIRYIAQTPPSNKEQVSEKELI